MKFDLFSDFHVEMNTPNAFRDDFVTGMPHHYPWDEQRISDVLVLAGDTSNNHDSTLNVVVEASRHYEHVLFVDGNHDHYTNYQNGWTVLKDMEWFCTQFNTRNKVVSNVTYLNGGDVAKVFGKTLFIGANGWYDFVFAYPDDFKTQWRTWQRGSNDPRCIRFGKKNKPHKLAQRQAEALQAQVIAAQDNDDIEEIVIVTHTMPTFRAFGQFGNPSHPYYSLNGAYGNARMRTVWQADKAGKIKTWCFGHTHEVRDFFERGIRFVSNPRGYRGERGLERASTGIVQIDTQEPEVASAFGEVEPS